LYNDLILIFYTKIEDNYCLKLESQIKFNLNMHLKKYFNKLKYKYVYKLFFLPQSDISYKNIIIYICT